MWFSSLSGLIQHVIPLGLIFFHQPSFTDDPCQQFLTSLSGKNLPCDSSQVIVVRSLGGFKAEITACQKQGGTWQPASAPCPGVIGAKGLAPIGDKKEGDLKTPEGLYPLGEAFGSKPLALQMDYKYITSEDKFIDDVNNAHYNEWVKGKTDAQSYEPMLTEPYQMGIVIDYNRNPVIPSAGSAIFIHIWRGMDVPTSGCVAMDKQHVLALLHWLDKSQQPYVYMTGSAHAAF